VTEPPKPPPISRTFKADSAGKLTPTERAILRALRDGLTLSQVADRLQRSELTVRTHIRNARAKLEIRGTEELRRKLAAGEVDLEIVEPPPT